jgi:diguanylate cyclase (GGDEF)-like protein
VRERLKRLGRRLRYALTPRPTPDRRFEVRRRRSIRLFLTFFLAIELGFALVGATTGGPGALATDRAVAMVAGLAFAASSALLLVMVRRVRSLALLELVGLLAGVVALAQSLFGQLHDPATAAAVTSYEAIAVAVVAFAVPWRPIAHYGFVAAASLFTLAGLLAVPSGADRAGFAGAVAFAWLIALIGKPLAWNGRVQLHLEASRVRHLRGALERSTHRDQLTGLETRRALDAYLAHLAHRREGLVAVAVIGIDHFSSFADRFGPPAAEQAVREVVAALCRASRDVDRLFLYSAGEFVMVFDPIDTRGPAAVAHRVRAEVEALGLPNPSSIGGLVTVSVATVDLDLPATSGDLAAAIARARRQVRGQRRASAPAASGLTSGELAGDPANARSGTAPAR